MCLNRGCGEYDGRHKPSDITMEDIAKAAEGQGMDIVVNRIGVEPPLRFYGSSFISDPYGRVLVRAPRNRPAVLVAALDLDQRRDWLELFPFLTTRRPETYGRLGEARPAVEER